MQDRNCKVDGGSRERKREAGRRRRREKERCDAIFTSIYGEIPGRDTLTTSKQDLWKTPGDLRYHYFPRGVCLSLRYVIAMVIGKTDDYRMILNFSDINSFKRLYK